MAFISTCLGWKQRQVADSSREIDNPVIAITSARVNTIQNGMVKWILFSTGFMAMAMEVIWTRAFTPVLKTQVYSFALIVFTYLGATFFGLWMYRRIFVKIILSRWKN
ncbi:MAG: hypothetical protein WDM76_03045 [Limisphaerales bacterium]